MDNLTPQMVEEFRNMMMGGSTPRFAKKSFYDKEFLLNMHDTCLGTHDNKLAEEGRTVQKTSTPAQHSSDKVKLIPANQITIATLVKSIDQVLRGKFLLCRVIAPAFKMTALSMVVDDPAGVMGVRLSLYNYTADVNYLPLQESVGILPVGTVLAIKNPWFKATMDGGLSLRCDNPDDVVVMDEASLLRLNPALKWEGYIPARFKKYMRNRPESDNEWKRFGNEQFVAKRYREAIEAYTNGLKSDPQNIDLLANRSAAYLNIEKFETALADAELVLDINPRHLKAIFRKTKALWGLQKYEVALLFLESRVIPMLPEDKQAHDLQSKTKLMIQQSKFGQYPMSDIANKDYAFTSKNSRTGLGQSLDWAEFQGPVLMKLTGDLRGRGVFATKKILAGQLIMASKAFGFVLKNKGHDLLFSANMETKLVSDASQVQLVSSIAHRLRNNPDIGSDLYQLYAGPELGSLNPNSDDCSTVDIKRIDSICTYNAFGFGSALDIEIDRFTGLWIQPSFINHKCIGCNCCWTVYGDFLLVRAFKDIEPGEEITISYTCPTDKFEERQQLFRKYGFECYCNLCEYDRQEPESVATEKGDLLKEIAKLEMDSHGGEEKWYSANAVESLLPKVHRLVELRPKYNLFMPVILDNLAGHYIATGQRAYAADCLERCYYIQEHTPLRTNIFRTTLNLVAALIHSGQTKKARHWFEIWKKVTVSCWGTDEVIQDLVSPNLMSKLRETGLIAN